MSASRISSFGGITNVGSLRLTAITVNGGSGIFNGRDAELSVVDSTISGNTLRQSSNVMTGSFETESGAGISNNGALHVSGSTVSGNTIIVRCFTVSLFDVDPLLGPLADNGGFTHTMALDPASPAVDAGSAKKRLGCPTRDQRGIKRPQGAGCDMGAFELTPQASYAAA